MADGQTHAGASTVRAVFSVSGGRISLEANAELPSGQTTLTGLLPVIQSLTNALVEGVGEEAAKAGKAISCRAGCGACCRQMVPVSLFEAEAMTAWIGTLPAEQRAELERRFHRALSALRDAGVIDKILNSDWVLEQERTTQLAIDYFHAGVPCPFLENESCSIHPIRPVACREYLVTSPPEFCKDPAEHQVEGIRLPIKFSRALFAFGQQLEQDPRGWIPLVFLLAWGKAGAKPGSYFAGSGEEYFRAFLEKVAAVSGPREE